MEKVLSLLKEVVRKQRQARPDVPTVGTVEEACDLLEQGATEVMLGGTVYKQTHLPSLREEHY